METICVDEYTAAELRNWLEKVNKHNKHKYKRSAA